MRNKKSVLKILSANSECFRVSAGIAPNKWIEANISTEEITKGKLYRAIGRAPKFMFIIQCNDKGNKSFIPMKYFNKISVLKKVKLWVSSQLQYLKNMTAKAKR